MSALIRINWGPTQPRKSACWYFDPIWTDLRVSQFHTWDDIRFKDARYQGKNKTKTKTLLRRALTFLRRLSFTQIGGAGDAGWDISQNWRKEFSIFPNSSWFDFLAFRQLLLMSISIHFHQLSSIFSENFSPTFMNFRPCSSTFQCLCWGRRPLIVWKDLTF